MNNEIDSSNKISQSGNTCMNSINAFSKIKISFSIFKSNKAFAMSNCLKIIGLSFNLSHSWFENMTSISEDPDLENTGVLSLSSDRAYLINITIVGNRAFKATGILVLNLNRRNQELYFDEVKIFQ